MPILIQAQLERGIVPGSGEKVQVPVVDIGRGCLFQAEAEGKTGLRMGSG
ncbi:MAG TPA: hypothetical protein VEU97_01465 [Ktedonobacteraceae bacterium]|nr:hypothetical protein [Ktedonobacteraceae bacterium]